MKHLALYRKWRPQTFKELVGQAHISRILLNALRQDLMAHAYLFCGPRGTGKTTSARLLAKALNCTQSQEGEPCNQCQNCEEISAGHSLDVIEIDAASNRGIDDARELREQVRFATTGSRYRVFIIDEFHMLTSEAFNALLKTLEEPPDKVVFVLATTEPHKILQTILSRCQRFDFQRIGLSEMLAHLKEVARAEGIGVSPQVLEAIARKASGGLRDALSLLDQVQALAQVGEVVPDDLVYQTLGLIQEEVLFQLLEGLFLGQVPQILETTQYLLNKGYDAALVVQETIHLLRHLLLAHLPCEQMEALGVPKHLLEVLKTLQSQLTEGQMAGLLEHLIQTSDRLHRVVQPEIWLEAEFMRYALLRENTLLERIEKLEAYLAHGGTVAMPPVTPKESAIPPSLTPALAPPPSIRPTQVEPVKVGEVSEPFVESEPVPDFEPVSDFEPEPLPPVQASPASTSFDAQDLRDQWQRFLKAFEVDFRPDIGFISNGRLVHIDPVRKIWIIRFASRPHKLRIEKQLRSGVYRTLIEAVAGTGYTLQLELEGDKHTLSALSPPTASVKIQSPPEQKPMPEQSFQPLSAAPSASELKEPSVEERPGEPLETPAVLFSSEAPVSQVLPEPSSLEEVRWVGTEPVQVVAELFKGKVIPLKSP